MVEPTHPHGQAIYEIRVAGEIPASLLERYPGLEVRVTPTETVLHREVNDLAALDRLLDQLQSLGLVLCELRQLPIAEAPHPVPARYEDSGDV